jgi:2-oxoglutarate dehydrogenase E2 component (dihydrolipoamide succinyltransferase)
MPLEIKIPAAGESVTSGQIAKWHCADGAIVNKGDLILTVDTDKVAAEVTAEASGKITILKQVGSDVAIGEVVGSIDTDVAAAPAAKPEAPKAAEPAPAPKAEAKAAKPAPKPEPAATLALPPNPQSAIRNPQSRESRKRMSPLRRKIADQLVNAQHTAAILTTFNECDMSEIMALRSKIQDSFVAKYGIKLGFMSFFVKAVVDALKAVPQINVRVEGDEIVSHNYFDVGVAVGTERGLVVPIIRDAENKSFADIEKDIAAYAGKAKNGQLTLADLTGGVFTISNGGIYGSMLSTPIINPPQSAILGMHNIIQRPIAVNGQVVIRPMMYLALSYDHRVVDGKEAVTFLIRVKDCIENPARLLVGA